jgi:hypothetical protein
VVEARVKQGKEQVPPKTYLCGTWTQMSPCLRLNRPRSSSNWVARWEEGKTEGSARPGPRLEEDRQSGRRPGAATYSPRPFALPAPQAPRPTQREVAHATRSPPLTFTPKLVCPTPASHSRQKALQSHPFNQPPGVLKRSRRRRAGPSTSKAEPSVHRGGRKLPGVLPPLTPCVDCGAPTTTLW